MDDAAELTALQKMFPVTALGGGDPIVGFNLLASMACTLANLAPNDGTVVHPNGSPVRLGTSLLVFGSASVGRVVDEIITEVCRRQNNLITHLRSHFELLEAIRNKRSGCRPDEGPGPPESVNPIEETQSPYGDMSHGHIESWRKVLVNTPGQTIRQIGESPKFLVSVGGRKDLESQLTRLRPGCPLVHLGLSHPGDLALFSDAASALLEGRFPLDDGSGTVRGNVLVTDPMRVLMAAARNPDERTLWLGHLLWLTDGDSGPDAPHGEAGCDANSAAWIEKRFRDALGKVMAYRFNPPEKKPIVLIAGIREASASWSGFLREMEPHLPGISGAARNLPASLAIGLELMAEKPGMLTITGLELMAAKPGMLTITGVEAMARFLVRRMANARTAILHASELARRQDQIKRIFHKLGGGPADERKLSADLKINAVDRDESLRWLEEANLLQQRPNKEWERCEGARLSFTDCSMPTIEV